MFIARVRGNIVTSQKVEKMTGKKLLIVDPLLVDVKKNGFTATGKTFIAVDFLGAGTDDLVLVTQGSSARLTKMTGDAPVDCVVIGIVDTVNSPTDTIYKKSETPLSPDE